MAETRIREALELLRERGWTKAPTSDGYSAKSQSPTCVGLAARFIPLSGNDLDVVKRIAAEQWPERFDANRPLSAFNDHPDTTFADVELVMEKAAVMREEMCDE